MHSWHHQPDVHLSQLNKLVVDFSHRSEAVDFDVEGIVLVELFAMLKRWQRAEQQHGGDWQQVDGPRQAAYVVEAVAGTLLELLDSILQAEVPFHLQI